MKPFSRPGMLSKEFEDNSMRNELSYPEARVRGVLIISLKIVELKKYKVNS